MGSLSVAVVLFMGLACVSCDTYEDRFGPNTIDMAPVDCCAAKGGVPEFLVTLLNECRAKNLELKQQLEVEKKKNSKVQIEDGLMDTELFQRFWNQCNARSAFLTSIETPTTTTTTQAPVPVVHTAMACEGNPINLACGPGSIIRILEANYGRTEGGHVCPHSSIYTTNCSAGNSKSIVSGRCGNVSRCSISASNQIFGDPCIGTYKYLKVTYSCFR